MDMQLFELDNQYKEIIKKKNKDKNTFMIILAISAVIAFIGLFLAGIPTLICIAFDISYGIVYAIRDNKYNKQASMLYSQLCSDMEKSILQTIGISSWKYIDNSPEMVIQLKSAQAVGKYDDIKFFKDNEGSFENAIAIMNDKKIYGNLLKLPTPKMGLVP